MQKEGLISTGTYSRVYAASKNNELYAFKRNIVLQETKFINNVRELDLLRKFVAHPHIVSLSYISFGPPTDDFILSPLTGDENRRNDAIHFIFPRSSLSLRQYIDSKKYYDMTAGKELLLDIIQGIDYLHQNNVMHRDIKPGNILLFYENERFCAKICDLGMARPFLHTGFLSPDVVSLNYRAPELLMNNFNYNFTADVWSLGCVIFDFYARDLLFPTSSDCESEFLEILIRTIPEKLTLRQFRSLTRKYEVPQMVNFTFPQNLQKNTSFYDLLNFNEAEANFFEHCVASPFDFNQMLNALLKFDFSSRASLSSCYEMKFFRSCPQRECHYPEPVSEVFTFVLCEERRNMWKKIYELIDIKNQFEFCYIQTLSWLSPLVLFHTVDLYDRFLLKAQDNNFLDILEFTSYAPVTLQNELTKDVLLDFVLHLCFYLFVKYFNIWEAAPCEDCFFGTKYHSDFDPLLEKLEGYLLYDYFDCQIFYPTLFEELDGGHIRITLENLHTYLQVVENRDDLRGKTWKEIVTQDILIS